MARAVWTGVITFGLVAVPVAMFPATREHEVDFHQFQKGTGDRIRYRRVNERTGKEVDYDDIVKGADVGGGDYVILEPEELDEIAPGRSRSLEIHQFTDLAEIDPLFYQKTYYLGPGTEEAAGTYVLLREAMAEAGQAAIGTLVMRNKEYLVTIRPDGDLLVLETMYFADEVRDRDKVAEDLPKRAKPRPQEMRMALQLIESMSGPWKPSDYRDTYTDRVKDLIAAKHSGGEITPGAEAPEPTETSDLLTALRRSVESARRGRNKKQPASRKKPAASGSKKNAQGSKAKPPKDMTKRELVVIAGDLDIPGRSTMDRGQLEKAIAKARKAA